MYVDMFCYTLQNLQVYVVVPMLMSCTHSTLHRQGDDSPLLMTQCCVTYGWCQYIWQ